MISLRLMDDLAHGATRILNVQNKVITVKNVVGRTLHIGETARLRSTGNRTYDLISGDGKGFEDSIVKEMTGESNVNTNLEAQP